MYISHYLRSMLTSSELLGQPAGILMIVKVYSCVSCFVEPSATLVFFRTVTNGIDKIPQ